MDHAKPAAGDRRKLKRLQFELALELGDTGEKPLAETLREAARAADAELVFLLPDPEGLGMTALVRLNEDGEDSFVQVRTAEIGFAVAEEEEINPALLGFARASVDVLQRLNADEAFRQPLVSAAH